MGNKQALSGFLFPDYFRRWPRHKPSRCGTPLRSTREGLLLHYFNSNQNTSLHARLNVYTWRLPACLFNAETKRTLTLEP